MRDCKTTYAGIHFARNTLEPSLWGTMRSMFIEFTHYSRYPDADALAHSDWWRTTDLLMAIEGLDLRYFQLQVDLGTRPDAVALAQMEEESWMDTLRSAVHEECWPIDSGEGSNLPLGTRIIEVRIRGGDDLEPFGYLCRLPTHRS